MASRALDTLKEFLSGVSGLALIILIIVAGAFLLQGTVYIGEKILPFLTTATGWFSLIFFLVLIPMGFTRRTRVMAGNGTVLFSYIAGFTLWFYSAVITYYLWGMFAIIVGLMLFGIGVLPIAVLAALFEGEWGLFGSLVYMIVLTYGSRMLGIYFLSQAEKDEFVEAYQAADFSEESRAEIDGTILDAEIVGEQRFCTNCGKEISSEATFCRFCGNKR